MTGLKDRIVALRRELHAHPETGVNTPWTARRIAAELEDLGISFEHIADNQVVGWIGDGDRAIAIRADMDGLPVREETGLPFASTNGAMHACGHDGHMAMLIGAAALLRAQEVTDGRVYLCFQSGEETSSGYDTMLEWLRGRGVDQTIALHLWADVPSGQISVVDGPRMAGVENIDITVTGVGGHGSRPDLAVDPIKPAAEIVLAASAVPATVLSPLESSVVHFGQLEAGTARNVYPERAVLRGQYRYFTTAARDVVRVGIRRAATRIAQAYGAQAEVTFHGLMPPVVNDEEAVERALQVLDGMDSLEPTPFELIFASENYSVYLEEYPGFMAYLGVKRPDIEQHYHHTPRFDIDENVLLPGAEFLARYAAGYLSGSLVSSPPR